jgi:hypothetical protein
MVREGVREPLDEPLDHEVGYHERGGGMRALALAWTLTIAGMAFWLSMDGGPNLKLPEPVHVVAHVGLFGALAAILVRPAGTDVALGLTLAAGALVELVQMLAVRGWLAEAGFDLVVDGLGAVTGLMVVRAPGVWERSGFWLHPVLLVPVALFGIGWAGVGDAVRAAFWTAWVLACLAPAVVTWGYGAWAGWYPHLDHLDAAQRTRLFAVTTVCAWGAAFSTAWWAPPVFGRLGLGLALGMTAVAIITRLGFKISGHTATPLWFAVAAWPWTERGAACLVFAGALLGVARVVAGRHRAIEVVAAWALAALAAAFSAG